MTKLSNIFRAVLFFFNKKVKRMMLHQLLTAHPVALCWCEGALSLSPAQDVDSQTPGAGLFTLLAA